MRKFCIGIYTRLRLARYFIPNKTTFDSRRIIAGTLDNTTASSIAGDIFFVSIFRKRVKALLFELDEG